MEGFHILATFRDVKCDKKYLFGGEEVAPLLKESILNSQLTPIKYTYALFSDNSYSSCYILAESHVTLHTWPEFTGLTLDIFVCNFQQDNTEKCKKLYDLLSNFFNPESKKEAFISR